MRELDFPKLGVVPLDKIRIDPGSAGGYNRPLRHRAKRLIRAWRPALCEPITVHMRADGTVWCVEGQARVVAARELGYQHLPARILDDQGAREYEARIFSDLSTGKTGIVAFDRWVAARAAREPWAVGIAEAAQSAGLKIDRHAGPQTLGSTEALKFVWDLGQKALLARALALIVAAWGVERTEALSGAMVRGVAILLLEIHEVEDRRISKRLRKSAPDELLNIAAKRSARRKHYPAAAFVAQELANVANVSFTLRRTTRIPRDAEYRPDESAPTPLAAGPPF